MDSLVSRVASQASLDWVTRSARPTLGRELPAGHLLGPDSPLADPPFIPAACSLLRAEWRCIHPTFCASLGALGTFSPIRQEAFDQPCGGSSHRRPLETREHPLTGSASAPGTQGHLRPYPDRLLRLCVCPWSPSPSSPSLPSCLHCLLREPEKAPSLCLNLPGAFPSRRSLLCFL